MFPNSLTPPNLAKVEYEALYILDGLLKNESDIQPNQLHGDTHAQSYTVFGLAYLLGIDLMPRIRNLKELNFYKPDAKTIDLLQKSEVWSQEAQPKLSLSKNF